MRYALLLLLTSSVCFFFLLYAARVGKKEHGHANLFTRTTYSPTKIRIAAGKINQMLAERLIWRGHVFFYRPSYHAGGRPSFSYNGAETTSEPATKGQHDFYLLVFTSCHQRQWEGITTFVGLKGDLFTDNSVSVDLNKALYIMKIYIKHQATFWAALLAQPSNSYSYLRDRCSSKYSIPTPLIQSQRPRRARIWTVLYATDVGVIGSVGIQHQP